MSSPSVKGFCKAQRSQFPFEEKNLILARWLSLLFPQNHCKENLNNCINFIWIQKRADVISKDSNEVDPEKWLITSDDLPSTSCSSFCKGTKGGRHHPNLSSWKTFIFTAQVSHPASQLSSKPWPMAYHGIKTCVSETCCTYFFLILIRNSCNLSIFVCQDLSSPSIFCKCFCCPGSGIGIMFGQREQRCLLESVSRVLHPCIMPVRSQHKKKWCDQYALCFPSPPKRNSPCQKIPKHEKGRFHVRREQPYICTNELTLPVVTLVLWKLPYDSDILMVLN